MSRGFTIIELTLSILFVSILLLAVATVTVRVGHLYEKGITIKTINQLGRETMDVLRRDIRQSASGVEFSSVARGEDRDFRLCLDRVAYIGNFGTLLNREGAASRITYGDQSTPARLVRVTGGNTAEYCSNPDTFNADGESSNQKFAELLASDTADLAVHAFDVTPVIKTSGQALYSIRIMIGTNEAGTLDEENRCRLNNDVTEESEPNFDYCSVAEFTTTVRTGGSL